MAKVKKKAATKTVKKKWFQVSAPALFLEQEIAEIPALEIKEIIGKKINLNLMTITREPKKQGIMVTFEIVEIKGDRAITEMTGYNVLPSSIKKMVRRNKNRIDGSYKIKTSDGYVVQVKPFLLTRTKAKGLIVKTLRRALLQHLTSNVSKMDYQRLLKDTIGFRIQKNIQQTLSKTYPVSQVELRVIKLITRGEKTDAVTEDKQE